MFLCFVQGRVYFLWFLFYPTSAYVVPGFCQFVVTFLGYYIWPYFHFMQLLVLCIISWVLFSPIKGRQISFFTFHMRKHIPLVRISFLHLSKSLRTFIILRVFLRSNARIRRVKNINIGPILIILDLQFEFFAILRAFHDSFFAVTCSTNRMFETMCIFLLERLMKRMVASLLSAFFFLNQLNLLHPGRTLIIELRNVVVKICGDQDLVSCFSVSLDYWRLLATPWHYLSFLNQRCVALTTFMESKTLRRRAWRIFMNFFLRWLVFLLPQCKITFDTQRWVSHGFAGHAFSIFVLIFVFALEERDGKSCVYWVSWFLGSFCLLFRCLIFSACPWYKSHLYFLL